MLAARTWVGRLCLLLRSSKGVTLSVATSASPTIDMFTCDIEDDLVYSKSTFFFALSLF